MTRKVTAGFRGWHSSLVFGKQSTYAKMFTCFTWLNKTRRFWKGGMFSKQCQPFFWISGTHVELSVSVADYKILCPGGEGFRPNPITVILEGKCFSFVLTCIPFG